MWVSNDGGSMKVNGPETDRKGGGAVPVEEYLAQGFEGYLEAFRRMVCINSWTENPAGVNELGEYTAGLFAGLDFSAEYVQSENPSCGRHLVLTKKGTSASSIACVSHLDTVYSPDEEAERDFRWEIEGDRVYGPGTNDIKGGTVVMYMVIDSMRAMFPEAFNDVNWVLLFDATEETESDDFGNLCRARIPADTGACLVFEAGNVIDGSRALVTSRKGRAEFIIEARGREAHAGTDHQRGINAAVCLAVAVLGAASITDYEKNLTVNVGKIHGGTALNRVPESSVAEVEMRAFSPEEFEKGAVSMMALEGEHIKVQKIRVIPPWPENAASTRLFRTWERAGQEAGIRVVAEKRGGLSDGNFLWDHVPVLDGLGPVGAHSHCSGATSTEEREYALLSSMVPSAMLSVRGILCLLSD